MEWFYNMLIPYCTEEQAGIAVAVMAVIITCFILKGMFHAFFPKR